MSARMVPLALRVNGAPVEAMVEPRQHLADFLREQRALTGTHLGCEHGVCGACTVLLDEVPVRGCITLAALCDGHAVCSIEGLAEDAIMQRLRAAFSAEHALQCGYCTPGMLITARDIVLRLPQADEARIRLELAGNLCRCTGYAGIVRAIARVLAEAPAIARAPAPPTPPAPLSPPLPPPVLRLDGPPITLRVPLAAPRAAVWAALQDPALIAACVPGASLTEATPERIAGNLRLALGPIEARFAGSASLAYDAARWSGRIRGEGQDGGSGSRLAAEAVFGVEADGAEASVVTLAITYALRGALAQFGKRRLIDLLAAEIGAEIGRNLEARLRGAAPETTARLGAGGLALRLLRRWLRGLFKAG